MLYKGPKLSGFQGPIQIKVHPHAEGGENHPSNAGEIPLIS
jgi:hypothetical protein